MPLKRYSTSNPQPTQEEFIHEFRSAFSKAKNILVVAGAGLSAASGKPFFVYEFIYLLTMAVRHTYFQRRRRDVEIIRCDVASYSARI